MYVQVQYFHQHSFVRLEVQKTSRNFVSGNLPYLENKDTDENVGSMRLLKDKLRSIHEPNAVSLAIRLEQARCE